jgi:tetratricopeptide (TPR) repeat protein
LRNYDWNWPSAEREYKRALELKPDYPTGHQWYAEFLLLTGRAEEAFAEMRRARELDPLSLMINSAFAWMYNTTDKPDKAIEECGRVLGMDSSYVPALSYLQDAYCTKGEYEKAIAVLKKLIPLKGGSERDVDSMERAYRTGGVDGFFRWNLRPLAVFRPQYFPHSDSVWSYIKLGEKTKALDVLERSFEDREVYVTFLKASAYLDPLRSEPRFIALMKKVGFEP